MALTWLAAVSFASQAKAEWSAQLFAREKSAETLARSAYTAPPRNNAKRPPGRHQDFPSVLKKRFRDDPHVAGQRSNYLPNQAVTPTGRSAALFTAKARGVNAYYLWFSTISVQALAPLLNVVPNEWKEPFSLYFEAKAAGRSKFELQFPRGRWLNVLTGDLSTGRLEDGRTDSWVGLGFIPAPEHMLRDRVTPLGDGWFGFEIRFDWGGFPPELMFGAMEPIVHGYVIGYWWLTDDKARWQHVGEAGKGFYLTEPEIEHLPLLETRAGAARPAPSVVTRSTW
jgi:hypothetical protein